eukprot:XP_011666581.1 PREDICTED: coiled-coil domain-containing protein 1-like [Strongylocentrotus purpuratus]
MDDSKDNDAEERIGRTALRDAKSGESAKASGDEYDRMDDAHDGVIDDVSDDVHDDVDGLCVEVGFFDAVSIGDEEDDLDNGDDDVRDDVDGRCVDEGCNDEGNANAMIDCTVDVHEDVVGIDVGGGITGPQAECKAGSENGERIDDKVDFHNDVRGVLVSGEFVETKGGINVDNGDDNDERIDDVHDSGFEELFTETDEEVNDEGDDEHGDDDGTCAGEGFLDEKDDDEDIGDDEGSRIMNDDKDNGLNSDDIVGTKFLIENNLRHHGKN